MSLPIQYGDSLIIIIACMMFCCGGIIFHFNSVLISHYTHKFISSSSFSHTTKTKRDLSSDEEAYLLCNQSENNNESSNVIKLPLECVTQNSPSSRIGCAVGVDINSGIVAVCGGMSDGVLKRDFHIYFMGKWIELSSPDEGDGLLYANIIVSNGCVFVFGGISRRNDISSAVRAYDFESKCWELADVTSCFPSPPARFNSSICALNDDSWLVYGGRGMHGALFADAWLLRIESDENGHRVSWTEVPIKGDGTAFYTGPRPREAHCAIVVNGCMFILGGHTGDDDEQVVPEGCVEVMDIQSYEWSLISTNGEGPNAQAITGGSAHALGDTGVILVVCGSAPDSAVEGSGSLRSCSDVFNHLYLLDTNCRPMTWSKVDVCWRGADKSMPPGSRAFHGAAMDREAGLLYVFGGTDIEGKEQDGLCILDCAELMNIPLDSDDDDTVDEEGDERTDKENMEDELALISSLSSTASCSCEEETVDSKPIISCAPLLSS